MLLKVRGFLRPFSSFTHAAKALIAIALLASHQYGYSETRPTQGSAPISLFVSVPSQHKTDEYLATCQEKLGDKYINCLARVHGDGRIDQVYSTESERAAPRGIHLLRDYREINGKQWFFYTEFDARGVQSTKSCVLDQQNKPENCFSAEWLDFHDMLVAGNGDRIYMYYVPRISQKVWFSGKALDLVLKRVNAKNEIVWEWSSADHDIADIRDPPRPNVGSEFANWIKEVRTSFLTNLGVSGEEPLCIKIGATPRCMQMHWVDFLHANSLAWDRDGGIVVSGRYINTVFKIDYPTGKVMWRLGGYKAKRSDFTIVNDPLGGFSYQHSVRMLPNGNMLLFDNGNNRPDQHTRAAEYKLDWEKKTATLVWSYPAEAEYPFRDCCGLVQRLKNGNTLIGWGGLEDNDKAANIPVATEVTPDGKVVFELRSRSPMLPYRVWKNEDQQ